MGEAVYYADKDDMVACSRCGRAHGRVWVKRVPVLSREPIKWVEFGTPIVPRSAQPLTERSGAEFWHDIDERCSENRAFAPEYDRSIGVSWAEHRSGVVRDTDGDIVVDLDAPPPLPYHPPELRRAPAPIATDDDGDIVIDFD